MLTRQIWLAGFAILGCVADPGEPIAITQQPIVVCAKGETVEGIDVSEWQESISWKAVRGSGRVFAIARVSYGSAHIDDTFPGNWIGMREAGLIRGAYQWFRPAQDANAQADIVIKRVGKLGPGDLPVTADVEETQGLSSATIVARLHVWVDRITKETGKVPIIYSGKYFWNDNIGSSDFVGHPLWIPQYGPVCPDLPSPWKTWSFFQYSEKGSIPGIAGGVDVNKFNGSLAELEELAGVVRNEAPRGALDVASCDRITGWAEDSDTPGGALDVHLYFDSQPGDPAAVARVVRAGRVFERATPRSLLDGKPHTVRAYAIDPAGKGPNAEIGSKTFTCARPHAPAGLRRWIPSPEILTTWKLDPFDDMVVYDDATIASYPSGRDLPASPQLISTDDSAMGVRILDGSFHRHVQSPASMDAWRFNWDAVKKISSAELGGYLPSNAWRERPFLIKGQADAIYLLDDRVDVDPGVVGPSPVDPGVVAPVPNESPNEPASGELTGQGSCATRPGPTPIPWLLLLLVPLLFRRRLAVSAMVVAGCAANAPEPLGKTTAAISVESAITSGGCSSAPVTGLSDQIVEELAKCVKPGFLVEVPSGGNLENDATHKYLELPAANALKAALATRGDTLHISSMFRTIVTQYYLYRHASCFPAVAPPGTSNHETAIAIDVSDPDNSSWRGTLSAAGFKWLGSFDRFHFDYVGAGAEDLRGQDVLAFQRLWNRNHPDDRIAEDGGFGPETEKRLKASPAEGFAIGAVCGPPVPTKPTNAAPTGSLDEITCATIGGSAGDADKPGEAIDVHLYFDSSPGDAAAIARAVRAGPGFSRRTPTSLLDGKPHVVRAFAIDPGGAGPNPQIGERSFTCAPPALVPETSARRWIPSPAVLTAWKLDPFEDALSIDDATLARFAIGRDLPHTPLLVSSDDPALGVMLIDGGLRRHVRDPASMEAWRFEFGAVVPWSGEKLASYRASVEWRPTPVIVKGSGPAMYVVDDRIEDAPIPPDPNKPIVTITPVEPGAPSDETGAWSGCSTPSPRTRRASGSAWLFWFSGLIWIALRRRALDQSQ